MPASTFKRFTLSAFNQFNPAESAAASPAVAKFGAIPSEAGLAIASEVAFGMAADAVDAISLNAAASMAWAADAKAMGRAAVPW